MGTMPFVITAVDSSVCVLQHIPGSLSNPVRFYPILVQIASVKLGHTVNFAADTFTLLPIRGGTSKTTIAAGKASLGFEGFLSK